MDNRKIGRVIAAYRKKKGLTQQQLADALGVTNKAVSKWETGQGVPDVGILPELSKQLDVSIDEILTGDAQPEEEPVAEFCMQTPVTHGMARTYCRMMSVFHAKRGACLCVAAAALLLLAGACWLYCEVWTYRGPAAVILMVTCVAGAGALLAARFFGYRTHSRKVYRKLADQGNAAVCRFYSDKFTVTIGESVRTWAYGRVTGICRMDRFLALQCGRDGCMVQADGQADALETFLRKRCLTARYMRRNPDATGRALAGWLLAAAALALTLIQVVYLALGAWFKLEYLYDIWFDLFNLLIVCAAAGSLLCFLWKKKKAVGAVITGAAVALAVLGWHMAQTAQTTQTVVDVSPEMGNVLMLKRDTETGETAVYRNGFLWFVRRHEQFPYTVLEPMKLQWLADDVCAVTYESPDDGTVHQYAATYGDRGTGAYYQVADVISGVWVAEENAASWSVRTGGGTIVVEGKDGEEYYGPSDCTQFGTLALTLNWQGTPRWTLVLDKGFSTENPDGGSLTLCRVSMDPTAPMQFTHVSLGEEPEESD